MARDYRKIVAWQRAHDLTLFVYQETKTFPKDERYGITSQSRRAAFSVASNVVEGSARASKKDYLRFLYIALGSLKETEYLLLLSRDLGYLEESVYERLTDASNATFAPLHGLMKSVKREAGIVGGLTAFLASSIILAMGRGVATV